MEKKLSANLDMNLAGRSTVFGPLVRAACCGFLAGMALLPWTGCSQRPDAPPLPNVSPSGAASDALALYDADDDGTLKGDEIWDTPLLLAAYSQFDVDNNNAITADEIAARVRAWQSSTSRIMRVSPTVFFDGQPLTGATVALDPAPFLGPDYPSATAVTDSKGRARFVGQDRRYPGVHLGLYTVRISKIEDGREIIPARYNSESEMALEVSPENWTNMLFRWFYLNKE